MHHKSAEHAFQYAKAMRCGYWDAAKFINERGCFVTAFTLFFIYITEIYVQTYQEIFIYVLNTHIHAAKMMKRKPMVPALKPSLQTPDEDPLIYFCLEGG